MDLREMLDGLDMLLIPHSFPTKNDALTALINAELKGYQGIQFSWSMSLLGPFQVGTRHVFDLPWNPVDILMDLTCPHASVRLLIDGHNADAFIMGWFTHTFQVELEFHTRCDEAILEGTGVFLRIGPLVALHRGSWTTRTHILDCSEGRIVRR